MFGDLGNVMKQVKEMKSKMKDVEKELNAVVIKVVSQDAQVETTIDGKLNIKALTIKPELVAKNDAKLLEKSVQESVKGAIDKAKAHASQKLSSVTGGLNIPGLT